MQDEGANWNPGKVFTLNKGDSLTVPVTNFTIGLGWNKEGKFDLDASCKVYGCNGLLMEDVWWDNKVIILSSHIISYLSYLSNISYLSYLIYLIISYFTEQQVRWNQTQWRQQNW